MNKRNVRTRKKNAYEEGQDEYDIIKASFDIKIIQERRFQNLKNN